MKQGGCTQGVSLVGPNVDLNGDLGGPGRPSEGRRTETQMCPRTHERTHLSHTRKHTAEAQGALGRRGSPGRAPMASQPPVTSPPPPAGSSISVWWQAAGNCTSVLSGIS